MYMQTNLFETFFDNLEDSQKIHAYDILKVLYYKSEEGLNLEQIYLIFKNKNRKLIRNIISELDISMIICNSGKYDFREHRYFITNEGIEFLYKHIGK